MAGAGLFIPVVAVTDVPSSDPTTYMAKGSLVTMTEQVALPSKETQGDFVVTVKMEKGELRSVSLPEVKGLLVEQKDSTIKLEYNNGAFSENVIDTWKLKPAHSGDFTIPAFDISTIGGEVFHLRAVQLHAATDTKDTNTVILVSSAVPAVTPLAEGVPSSVPSTFSDYFTMSIELYKKGDFAGAIKACTQAIALEPKKDAGYSERAMMERDHGDLAGALADYTQAIQLDPTDGYAFAGRGLARKMKGDLNGALEDYDQSLRLNLDNFETYERRADVRKLKGDGEGAEADMAQAQVIRQFFAKQEPIFVAMIEPAQATVGQDMTLRIEVDDTDDAGIVVPKIAGLEVVQHLVNSVPDKTFQLRVAKETFILHATRPGDYSLPVYEISPSTGHVLYFQTLKLHVADQPGTTTLAPGSNPKQDSPASVSPLPDVD